ncbi:MAG TPA: dihydrolipoamide acetyltransferase family protein [Bacillales bacterium]|nr:dihydrolipoamide acetyltransferase family protein [Bacillales bacterium]
MTDVKLHDIGEGMTEAEILRFFVKVGDSVKADEPLLEVQTDKMTAELPSPAAGTVTAIKAEVGDVVEVGTTIIELDGGQVGSEESEAAPEAKKEEPSGKKTATIRVPKSDRVLAAPYTRKLAMDHGVDIEKIEGSGPEGRVTEADVNAYVNGNSEGTSKAEPEVKGSERRKPAERPIASPAARKLARQRGVNLSDVRTEDPLGRVRATDVATHREGAAETTFQEAEEIPFRGRRKAIANKMTQSLYTIPHVTHFDEVDVTELFRVKQSLKATNPEKNVSAAAFFIKALQKALEEVPIFNAKLDEENEVIRLEKTVNIGLATDTEEGLIVPVIHHVEELSLLEIHQQMKTLIQKAKDNQLRAADMSGGTFTISNVGPLGSTGATPIINYPEVGLMAFHKTKKMPVVRGDDEIVIRQMMNVSMTFDHRVADGAKAVMFTNQFIRYIENPHLLLVELV